MPGGRAGGKASARSTFAGLAGYCTCTYTKWVRSDQIRVSGEKLTFGEKLTLRKWANGTLSGFRSDHLWYAKWLRAHV